MSGDAFSAGWLALREPADRRARSRQLATRFLAATAGAGTIVDLGAGTGANARYLQDAAADPFAWRLVDADPALLSRAGAIGAGIETVVADLADIRPDLIEGAAAVTCAALLDLVSETWLAGLSAACARADLPVLFALGVDGRVRFDPEDPDDDLVMDGFRRDQSRDKGFGPALGPDAPDAACRAFSAAGFSVIRARSDWALSGDDAGLLDAYLKGVAAAAAAGADAQLRDMIAAWSRRRRAAAGDRRLAVEVGHADVLALPS